MIRFVLFALFILLLAPGGAAPLDSLPAVQSQNAFVQPAAAAQQGLAATEQTTNVIFFMADGMGYEHVRAASMFAGRPMVFESFTHTSEMTTDSVEGVTDSAAAATAMATGQRVNNKVISMALPGDGEELPSVLDLWQAQGSRVGLVTTSTINDASPAAFAAHEPTRDNKAQIAQDYFEQSRPHVLMGGTGEGVTEGRAEAAGYTIVTDAAEMLALDTGSVAYLSGQFGDEQMPPIEHGREPLPSLAQMTETALGLLDDGPAGFFLLVEQEGTDSYSHSNDIELMVNAMLEFEEAVQVGIDYAAQNGNTLLVVSADHETGGLEIKRDNGPGELPTVDWTAESRHTDRPVPIYAQGPGAQLTRQITDVTELHKLLEPQAIVVHYDVYFPLYGR